MFGLATRENLGQRRPCRRASLIVLVDTGVYYLYYTWIPGESSLYFIWVPGIPSLHYIWVPSVFSWCVFHVLYVSFWYTYLVFCKLNTLWLINKAIYILLWHTTNKSVFYKLSSSLQILLSKKDDKN